MVAKNVGEECVVLAQKGIRETEFKECSLAGKIEVVHMQQGDVARGEGSESADLQKD